MSGLRAPRAHSRSTRSRASFLAAVAVAACACSDPPLPVPFDGSFLIGDAAVFADGLPRDVGPPPARDAAPAAEDAPAPIDAEERDADPPPDTGPVGPCSATATITVTATEAVARLAELDGVLVDLVATASVSLTNCTRIACTPKDPCCNTCTADILLDRLLPLRAGMCASQVGCTGDECNLVCSPPVLGFPQTFRGVVRSAPTPGLELMRVLP